MLIRRADKSELLIARAKKKEEEEGQREKNRSQGHEGHTGAKKGSHALEKACPRS